MNFMRVRRYIKLSGGLYIYFWQPLFSVYKENNSQTYEINTKDNLDRNFNLPVSLLTNWTDRPA